MVRTRTIYDVFISHARSDSALAATVAKACRAANLATVSTADLQAAPGAGDEIWEALTESRALLVILPASELTPNMSIEIGAARAWSKPIYSLATDPATSRIPSMLVQWPIYPLNRIEDVIDAIVRSGQQLSDADRTALAEVYRESDVPADRLALEPRQLDRLVRKFQTTTGKAIAGEELLSELLRMRKQGRLTKLRNSG